MPGMTHTVKRPGSPDKRVKTYIHEHVRFGCPGHQGDASIAPVKRGDALQLFADTCFGTVVPDLKKRGLSDERIGPFLVENPKMLLRRFRGTAAPPASPSLGS